MVVFLFIMKNSLSGLLLFYFFIIVHGDGVKVYCFGLCSVSVVSAH